MAGLDLDVRQRRHPSATAVDQDLGGTRRVGARADV
jgi:hypothetical protein